MWQGKWVLAYHAFTAEESTDASDYGKELNAQYTRNIYKNINGGIKYAMYNAGDEGTGKVDTDKLWLWVQAKF